MKSARQSWEDEHAEFKNNASELKPSDEWKFGFYQIVPDASSPKTKLKDNSFMEFLIPEEHLSLKLFFDNLRNYGICAAFAILGLWVWSNAESLLGNWNAIWLIRSTAIAIWILVGCLLLLNCIQTWTLTREMYFSLRAIRISKTYIFRGDTRFHFVLGVLYVAFSWLQDVIVSVVLLLASAAVVAMSVGFVMHIVFIRHM